MGSVFQQKGIWRLQYYREGRQYIESSRSHRKEDAVRLLKLREGAIAKGLPVARESDACDLRRRRKTLWMSTG